MAEGAHRDRPGSAALYRRACEVITGGVNSPVRAYGAVGGDPVFVARGKGSRIWDVDGHSYIDYVQSYGASILGHADPAVIEAVISAARLGTTFGAPTESEVLVAEAVRERVPGCEQLRLTSSGTEATMTALRVARGYTGRDRVVKFDGCYHGHGDALLAGGGSGVATLGLPGSAGVPPSAVADTVVVPYNRAPEPDGSVACVIVEPVAANMGLVPPAPGFLESLRRACDDSGALLVFDEVITGFRVARGGASQLTGVTPDLWCFGKVIGGGLPIGALGGRREVMEVLAPVGPVYQAGTLSGNPLATAAGLAVLERLDEAAYQALSSYASRLAAGLESALAGGGVDARALAVGPLVGLFFSSQPVHDYSSAREAASNGLYARFFREMLDQGVAFAPGPYEAVFPSLAHGERDLELTLEAASRAAAAMGTAGARR